jgi:hypothetical protein
MGFLGSKVVEKGMFTSPALGVDSQYELIEDDSMPQGLAVRCVESKTTHDISVLAQPTLAQLTSQHQGFVREISAWLVANAPQNTSRQRAAVREIRRLTSLDYVSDDLENDVEWVRTADLSKRMHVLGKHLDEARRVGLIELAATVGAAGDGLAESDAQFIEILGTGLQFDTDTTMQTVMNAVNNAGLAAA